MRTASTPRISRKAMPISISYWVDLCNNVGAFCGLHSKRGALHSVLDRQTPVTLPLSRLIGDSM
jgi:hypothetical protein